MPLLAKSVRAPPQSPLREWRVPKAAQESGKGRRPADAWGDAGAGCCAAPPGSSCAFAGVSTTHKVIIRNNSDANTIFLMTVPSEPDKAKCHSLLPLGLRHVVERRARRDERLTRHTHLELFEQ